MSRKYQAVKRIRTIAEFENCKSDWFIVVFGNNQKTVHRSFLISWQYRLLQIFINKGCVYQAEKAERPTS